MQVGGGLMKMEHARVDNCGRVALGEYCLHLHLVGDCPSCAMRGNVVEGGVNKGITLHGTQRSERRHLSARSVRTAAPAAVSAREVRTPP